MKIQNNLNIVKKLTYQQYKDSDYPQRECENFGYEHLMKRELERWNKYDPQVFITEEDPKHNYGLNFKVWLHYKADGLYFFASISYGSSSISSGGFRSLSSPSFVMDEDDFDRSVAALPHPTSVEYFTVHGSDDMYVNDNATRNYFRKNDHLAATNEF